MVEKIPRSVGVHDGTFHADEVTACALLIVFDRADADNIIRSRDLEELAKCEYVCDVGGIYDPKRKLFDHHQVDYKGDLSSAGMILLYLKDEKALSEEEYHFFRNSLIKGIDDHDNGKAPQINGLCSFSHIIANFPPISHSNPPETMDNAFFEALDFTVGHLKRLWERYQYNLSCREMVQDAMEKYSNCLIFDQSIPWIENFFSLNGKEHPAKFVIMPAGEHWKLRGIPPDFEHRMQVRVPLPEEWAGLLADDLKQITGIQGSVFCHKGRFTSVWETRDDAIQALKIVLKKNKIQNEDAF